MHLNAYLARAGVASRRGADELIKAGRVTVNGEPGSSTPFVECARPRRGRRPAGRAAAARATCCSTSPPAPSRPRATRRGGRTVVELVAQRAARRSGRAPRRRHDRRAPAHERRRRSRTGSRTRATASRRSTRPRSRATPTTRRSQRLARRDRARRRPDRAGARRGASAPAASSSTLHEGRKHQVKRMLAAVGHPVHAPAPQPLRGPDARRARARRVARARALRGGSAQEPVASASACASRSFAEAIQALIWFSLRFLPPNSAWLMPVRMSAARAFR